MATKPESNEDDSFIILGTSPGTSLDLKCDGVSGGGPSLDPMALDDAMKELSNEASMAFKAHFKLGDGPSPASLMVASNIITDDKSTEELQKRFGEILDENVILKETLQKNNESMKDQFLMIASCQEDMMKTHTLHKEKFDETRELVDKLRQENKKLKLDVARLMDDTRTSDKSATSSGPPSALEFVTSPDDDTIDKLTTQLELVEKQRRQVIVENEKLTWQKESLEHLLDATCKERDDFKEKVKNFDLQSANIENEHAQKIRLLNDTIQHLQNKFESEKNTANNTNRAETEAKLESLERSNANKIAALQNDLKQAQLRILELENVKLDFTKYKSGVSDTIKLYKDQIQELQNKLKEAQTTVFQPVRFSVSTESVSSSGEYASFIANVKVYDKTLKHLADLLNLITHGSVDSLVHCIGVVASLSDVTGQRANMDQLRAGLGELRQLLDKQHTTALSNIGQVRGIMSIFEGMFKDYNQLLKKELNRQDYKPASNVEQLTAALLARGQELQLLQAEVMALRSDTEDKHVLTAQLECYKSDFEAEREAREKMASEKDNILKDLRTAQRRVQELTQQFDELRNKQSGNPQQSQSRPQSAANAPKPTSGTRAPGPGPKPTTGTRRQSTPAAPAGSMGRRYDPELDDDCALM